MFRGGGGERHRPRTLNTIIPHFGGLDAQHPKNKKKKITEWGGKEGMIGETPRGGGGGLLKERGGVKRLGSNL